MITQLFENIICPEDDEDYPIDTFNNYVTETS